ncbi:ABC transporter ATP-binding protein [Crenobacter luteus]|uniref:ABC transporter ATP-binding protein n=1 Tax=Crenobacter luteus TaxID=1452487 RepID=A0A163DSC6_9NEIS|nr:ABC transporter ATP-binding protein [Crenobacter luteus]KZE35231.1 ABC transporter ATP-binding protein [Crenobacter luteus]
MLELVDVSKRYGGRVVAEAVSLALAPGELVALLGPSGCGKSTLLNMVAGLVAPDAGEIRFAGARVDALPPERRGFALMFQDFALFPHLDVLDNVAFGLVERRVPRAAARERARRELAAVGLAGFETRRVAALSGGEKQRVALARALATDPRLLLLDEPFSSLDAHLRASLQAATRQRLAEAGIPALLVTHDRDEALAMADRVAVLDAGRVAQLSPAAELMAKPANERVARFLGLANVTGLGYWPQAALRLGGAGDARVLAATPRAGGLTLELALPEGRFVLELSAREAAALAEPPTVGARVPVTLDAAAFCRFGAGA